MPINESLGNPLYFLYKDAGPSFGLIFPAVLLNLIAICGVVMNSFVVITTILTKALHGTANFLVAMICCFEVLHQSGHLVFLYVATSGTNFIEYRTSAVLELPMIFGLNATFVGIALAAFDRLFAVIARHKHREMNRKVYLGILLLLCIGYGLCWTKYVYSHAQQTPDVPVTGLVSEVLSGELNTRLFVSMALINSAAALCYLLVWVVIRAKKSVTEGTNTRLLRSLVIIVAVNIGGYFITLGMYKVLFSIQNVEFVLIWRLMMIGGIALNVGAACNAPVLYFTSIEYRKAFSVNAKNLSSFLLLCFGKSKSVAVGKPIHVTATNVGRTRTVAVAPMITSHYHHNP